MPRVILLFGHHCGINYQKELKRSFYNILTKLYKIPPNPSFDN